MITNTRAIVLNHLRYGDSSLIVNLYTENMGRQSVLVKGMFRKKPSIHSSFFQPLHLLETTLHHRMNRHIQRMSNIQIYCPFKNIPFDPVKNCIAMFISEILHKTLKEEEANTGLFDFLLHTIQALDLNEYGTANFHLVFLIHYTRYLGFYPGAEQLSANVWFDLQNVKMTFAEFNGLLAQLFGMSFDCLDSLQINHHQRNFLVEYLMKYYSMHVDNFGKLKSLQVLQNIF